MWKQSYSITIKASDSKKIWDVWIDVNNWDKWQADIDQAKLDKKMSLGSVIQFKPKGGPNFNLEVTEFVENKKFTDLTKFPLAKMYDEHEIIVKGDEIEIKTTISISGPLSFIWRKIVAENIVKGLPEQTEALINRAVNG